MVQLLLLLLLLLMLMLMMMKIFTRMMRGPPLGHCGSCSACMQGSKAHGAVCMLLQGMCLSATATLLWVSPCCYGAIYGGPPCLFPCNHSSQLQLCALLRTGKAQWTPFTNTHTHAHTHAHTHTHTPQASSKHTDGRACAHLSFMLVDAVARTCHSCTCHSCAHLSFMLVDAVARHSVPISSTAAISSWVRTCKLPGGEGGFAPNNRQAWSGPRLPLTRTRPQGHDTRMSRQQLLSHRRQVLQALLTVPRRLASARTVCPHRVHMCFACTFPCRARNRRASITSCTRAYAQTFTKHHATAGTLKQQCLRNDTQARGTHVCVAAGPHSQSLAVQNNACTLRVRPHSHSRMRTHADTSITFRGPHRGACHLPPSLLRRTGTRHPLATRGC